MKAITFSTIDNSSSDDPGGVDMAGEILPCLQLSSHALQRSRQRGIPPLIIHWLCQYGARRRGCNGILLYTFDRKSLRLVSSEVGHIAVRMLSSLMNACLVIAGKRILTVGHRY